MISTEQGTKRKIDEANQSAETSSAKRQARKGILYPGIAGTSQIDQQ